MYVIGGEGSLDEHGGGVPRRRLNRFVNEALAKKVAAVERQQLEQAMQEGYLATRRERAELNGDWTLLDTAEWPE